MNLVTKFSIRFFIIKSRWPAVPRYMDVVPMAFFSSNTTVLVSMRSIVWVTIRNSFIFNVRSLHIFVALGVGLVGLSLLESSLFLLGLRWSSSAWEAKMLVTYLVQKN